MNKKMIALLLAVGGCTNGMHALKTVNGDVSRQDLEAAAAIADVLAEDDSDDSQAMADMQDEGSRWDRAKAGASNLWNRAANSRFGQAVGDAGRAAGRTIANNKKKAALVAAVLAMIASRSLYTKGYGRTRSRFNPLRMNYGFNTRLDTRLDTAGKAIAAATARARSIASRQSSVSRGAATDGAVVQ